MDDLLYSNPAYRLARITQMLSAGVRKTMQLSAGVGQQLLPANGRRVAVTLGLTQGSNLTLWVGSAASGVPAFLIDTTEQPLTLAVSTHGPWVQGELWVTAGGALISLSVIETAVTDGDFDPSSLTHNQGQANA